MVLTLLTRYAAWLVLIGGLLFGLSVWIAARAAIQSRRAAYYILREEAVRRTRRWSLVAVLVLTSSIAIVVYASNQPAPVIIADTFTPTPLPIVSPASASPSPTLTATPTSRPTLTATSPPTPTPTPTLKPGSVPDLLLTPIPSAVPPAPAANLTFTTLASVLDNNKNPVDPGLVFPAGTKTIQIFFHASGVNNGAAWSVFCTKGNQLVDHVITLWRWGTRPQGSRAFCSIDGSVGAYTVSVYLGFTRQIQVTFSVIVPPPTFTPTPPLTATP